MAISRRISGILSSPSLLNQMKTLIPDQQVRDLTVGTVMGIGQVEHTPSISGLEKGLDDSNWKIIDSKTLRIKSKSVPPSALRILKTLQANGYATYLVGGCVRDLVLQRAPKDFDVITTASLRQIKRHFHHCIIIGRRFPICQVHILGNVVEVSSFNTVSKHGDDQEATNLPKLLKKYNEKDLTCWKNCMKRDFSINCLFFDPLKCKIYDYVDAFNDLKSFTVRTVIPPHLSFKEDCARILRGMRIAARLGLQFSKKTEAAILDLSSSIQTLNKDRLMMEMNFMMAHGAAASSVNLLQKFKLLESLFPAQAAYLSAQSNKSEQSVMLMKLLVNADNLLRADRPCCCNLWLGLLAFHMALVDNPQDALVIWTFSSMLYHGTWNEAVEFANGSSNDLIQFVPEITQSSAGIPDDLLFEETSRFVSLAKSAVEVFTNAKVLQQSLAKHGSILPSRCSVFASQNMGKKVCELFDVMNVRRDPGGKRAARRWINYALLKKGDLNETRFVLGKIIMDTMKGKPISKGKLISEPDRRSAAAEQNKIGLSSLF